MAITNLPAFFNMIYVNKEDGRLSADGYLYNDQTFQVLNEIVLLLNGITTTTITGVNSNDQTVTINGLNPPSKTTVEISSIAAETDPNKQVPLGTIWYDSDMKKLRFLSDTGVIETITSTP